MNKKLFNVVLYKLNSIKKSILILTLVMVLIALLSKIIEILIISRSKTGQNVSSVFSGFDIIAVIFLFVGFMASFKETFNHLSVNSITRRLFFKSEIIFIVCASFILFILVFLLNGFYNLLGINTKFALYSIYPNLTAATFSALFISLLFMASSVGLLFTVLSYRYGTPMILFLSISPVLIFMIGPILVFRFGLRDILIKIFSYYFGYINNSPQPLAASLNFIITSAIFCGVSWIVMKKMPVKM